MKLYNSESRPTALMNLAAEIVALLREHYIDSQALDAWIQAVEPTDVCKRLPEIGISHTHHLRPDEIDYFHLLVAYCGLPGFAKIVRRTFPGGVHYPGIGILPRKGSENRWFASAIMPGGPAARVGLRVGDELIAVNGAPYAPITPFIGLEGCDCELVARRTLYGAKRQFTVKVKQTSPRRALPRATRGSIQRFRAHDGSAIGYIRPWSLAGDRHWRLVTHAATNDLADCKRLILDLRGGIAGSSPDFAEFFIGGSPELKLYPRSGAAVSINSHWRKPVILLVDATTRSGNEVLAFALQRHGATIVGTRTAGAVAAARPFLLTDRSILLIATHRVEVDGTDLEGVGVAPDIAVEPKLEYSAGEDPILETALALDA
ncbi:MULTISPECIES: S41 family peptidase [unclassified Sinorhizobium]|uniref:S41 family peptidase n=1 Tax=unclassified Sinorhizobium TaxID=2613772 RepID=UPI0024C311F6|nr:MULTISPECIES: S41 family peptidase [unclassified Sinorhizobium]MDK1376431.1 S41 family peptidase [Sinorhizobium sp. 6-70]MDK1479980.1 S41 family peptidase [Sinorhizobium sp. 6-117]